MRIRIDKEKQVKLCRELNRVLRNYRKEVKEHKIEIRLKKTPKREYRRMLRGLEILEKAHKIFCINKKALSKKQAKDLMIPLKIMKGELVKYDIFVLKKTELDYYEKNIIPLQTIIAIFI